MTIRSSCKIEEKKTPESLFFTHLLRPPGALEEALETPHAGSPPPPPRPPLAHLLLGIDHNIIPISAIRGANSIVFSAVCNPIEIDHRVGIELRRRETRPQREVFENYYTLYEKDGKE